jgi:hypothetical protein
MPKANMMIIRGRRRLPRSKRDWSPLKQHVEWMYACEEEFVSESFTRLNHHAYCRMSPLTTGDRGEGIFEMVLLVPGQAPIRTRVEFNRGCNGLSMAPEIAELIPPEFFDPIQAMDYAAQHGLDTPPYVDVSNWKW